MKEYLIFWFDIHGTVVADFCTKKDIKRGYIEIIRKNSKGTVYCGKGHIDKCIDITTIKCPRKWSLRKNLTAEKNHLIFIKYPELSELWKKL